MKTRSWHVGVMALLSIYLFFFSFVISSGQARNDSFAAIKARLAKIVSINTGNVAMAEVGRLLSAKTNISIKPAKYLEEHRVFLCMSNVSASHVLDSLCELNNWRWIILESGDVVIARQILPRPVSMEEFPTAFNTIYPKAWLPFLGLGPDYVSLLSKEDMESWQKNYEEHNAVQGEELRKQLQKDDQKSLYYTSAKRFCDLKSEFIDHSSGDEERFPPDKKRYRIGMNLKRPEFTKRERDGVLTAFIRELVLGVRFDQASIEQLAHGIIRHYYAHPEDGIIGMSGGFLAFGEMITMPDGSLKPGYGVGMALDLK